MAIPLPRKHKLADYINPINTITEDDRLLTTKQTCELLQIERTTLYRYAENKWIHRTYIGAEPRFSHKSILAYLNRESPQ